MLLGVGGRTIAEAKASISHAEAMQWRRYIQKYSIGESAKGERWYMAHMTYFLALLSGHKEKFDVFSYQAAKPVDLDTAMETWQ